MKMVKVSLNGNTYEYPEGTRYLEIAADMQKSYLHDIVLVSANKRLRELNKKLYEDAELLHHGGHGGSAVLPAQSDHAVDEGYLPGGRP